MNQLLEQLKAIVGPDGWTSDPDELQPHVNEWRGVFVGVTPLMVMPATTDEVSRVVAACAAAGVAVVPQGGNTGMCAGSIPDDSGKQILLSLARMNRIRALDADNFSVEVEAGCILQTIQEAAQGQLPDWWQYRHECGWLERYSLWDNTSAGSWARGCPRRRDCSEQPSFTA